MASEIDFGGPMEKECLSRNTVHFFWKPALLSQTWIKCDRSGAPHYNEGDHEGAAREGRGCEEGGSARPRGTGEKGLALPRRLGGG